MLNRYGKFCVIIIAGLGTFALRVAGVRATDSHVIGYSHLFQLQLIPGEGGEVDTAILPVGKIYGLKTDLGLLNIGTSSTVMIHNVEEGTELYKDLELLTEDTKEKLNVKNS